MGKKKGKKYDEEEEKKVKKGKGKQKDEDEDEDDDDEDEDEEETSSKRSKGKDKKKDKKKGKGKSAGYTVLDEETCKIRLNNVRLSFPALFTPKAVGDDSNSTPKFSAVLLLDNEEHADTIEYLQEQADRLAKEVGIKKLSITKCFLKPGSEKDDLEGFENAHFVTASNARRPLALNDDKSAVTEADGILYAGCYVNAVVQLWGQDNKWGKRVNASLEGVQFVADGESLGGGTVADEDDFE